MAREDQNQNSVGKQAANQAKEFAKQKAKEQLKKMAAKKGVAAAMGPVLFWAAIIIMVIILLTGIIAFLLTAPGLVTGKLKNYAETLAHTILNYWGGDTTQMEVSEEEQYKVLDYLEQMGYDLKGYGFIDSNVSNTESDNYDQSQGVLRDPETGKIAEANSYLVMLYLSSDNYVYTVKNFNPVVPGTDDLLGSFFFYMYKFSETFNLYHRFLSLFNIGVLDETAMWGKGLLSIYFEGSEPWHRGSDYSKNIIDKWFGTNTTWTNIKVDPDKKTMSIRRGWGANYYEYELDGWTGRYGMPLEFLLSVQIATLKPDLAYEMATGFNTDVLILLRDISSDSSVVSSYLTDGGKYITYEDVENTIHAFKDDAGGFITDIINWFDDNQITDEELAALQELGFEDSLTKDELKTIIDELDDANKYDFKTYVPYLSRVTDHWYRDVYFVVGADSNDAVDYSSPDSSNRVSTSTSKDWWVTTDLDYEAVTNERWTEYKKYKGGDDIPEGLTIGDYILYVYYDPSGTYSFDQVFPGTQEQADQAGIKVYKKADTGSVFSLIDKGILDEYEDGADTSIWTAYESEKTGTTAAYKRLYPDEEEGTYKGKLYYKEILSNNVVQKQDALRRETNPRIKQMFLTRKYFTYDGTAPRADAIMQVREKINNLSGSYKNINNVNVNYSDYLYGAIPEELIDGDGTEFTINDPENNGKTKKVNLKDMVSTVSLNQDSLAAFAMLENTHTEDADFIYKDFKELIVELGFFTKEDLTEGSAKQLEFPVPSIGSGGYPYRYIDKNKDVLGTKIHSREDVDASKKLLIAYMLDNKYDDAPYLTEDAQGGPGLDNGGSINGYVDSSNISLGSPVAGLNRINQVNYTNVGSARDIAPADYTFTPTGNHGRGVKTGDLTINGVDYEVWQQTVVTCTLWSFGFVAQAYTGEPQNTYCTKTGSTAYINQDSRGDGTNSYWSDGVLWSMFDQVGISGQYILPGEMERAITDACEALDEGKPVYFYGDYAASGDCHAVVLLGADSSGKVLIYNPGGGTMDLYGSSSSFGTNLEALFRAHFKWRIFIPDELPTGVNRNKTEANPYEGYLGNEAVVSPVTGILLDYGVYNDEDGENGYRNNTDENVKPEFLNGPDKVGYAKILVLSNEIANQFVKLSKDGSGVNANVVKITPPDNKEDFEEWSSDQKALYGYALFADGYEKAKVAKDASGEERAATSKTGRYENLPEKTHGIAGYIVYIDGFVPELPNEDAQQYVLGKEDEDGDFMKLPDDSTKLSYDVFKKYGYNIGSSDVDDKENLYTLSQYEPDKVYKMQSQTVQDREDAKAEGKKNSVNILNWHGSVNGETRDWVILKEGTVIGRTMSNKELMTKIRGLNNYVEPQDVPEEEYAYMYGNYLRLIFKNRDDENIENIEDYMKLDEEEGSNTKLVPQPYKQDPDGNDPYRLASMLDHELCAGSSLIVNSGKCRDKSGNWRLCTKEDSVTASKVTVYVCLNNAILQDCYISEILSSGAYGDAGVHDAQATAASHVCPDCLEIAEWCLKYDCMSVESSEGVTMTRNCRTESAFDVTCTAWTPGVLEHWWLLDIANLHGGYGADGTVADYDNNKCYDCFFLRYKENDAEYDARPVMPYTNVTPCPKR